MILLDTGYLIALLKPRDTLHSRAVAWSKTLKERTLVTEYVIWETANAFSSPTNRVKLHPAIVELRSDPNCEWVSADQVLFEEGLRLHRDRPDKSWSLTDCISFVLMEARGITRALTHDRHFEQAGFEALLRRDPEQV